MSNLNLTDITRGMHHAASTTCAMISQQYLEMMHQFFDYDEEDRIHAKMIHVKINEEQSMLVPLITLAAPRGLALENMKIRMAVRIDKAEAVCGTHGQDNSEATRGSFSVSVAPIEGSGNKRNHDVVDIEMEFKATEPPEGIMRLIDSYTNMIMPERHSGEIKGDRSRRVRLGKPLAEPPLDNESP